MSVCSFSDPAGQLLRSGDTLLSQPALLLNDRYRILRSLGQGGFGKTFLAVDEWQPPLCCVIKQLLPSYSIDDQKVLIFFQQEAARLAELGEHSQIPRLLNTFLQNGHPFIVQEWIEGWTLQEEIADAGPFNEMEVRMVLQALLPVLDYLHDRQIIHRDIKPANIIRRKRDRQLVLVDFGAAKQLSPLNSCHTGTMIGSVEYAAPEQIRGQAIFASDLYSLGVTCLYLLTQVQPFDLYDIVEDEWKWQAYLPQPISSNLKTILHKLLQPAVRRRYQSVEEVLSDLNLSVVFSADQQADSAIAHSCSDLHSFSGQVNDSPLLKSFISRSNFVKKIPSVSGTTVSLTPVQDWYDLSPQESTSDQEALLFAEEIAAIKALPLWQRVFVVSIGTIIGSVAVACLVFCLGAMLFALSTPPSNVMPLKSDRSALSS
jgi:serine/threonine protein kinase